MYKKLTFNVWLCRKKNFNSYTHFKNFIDSLKTTGEIKTEAIQYYKNEYADWYFETYSEVI